MAKVKILEKQYNMKFNLGFWEKMKEIYDLDRANLETRLNEDFVKYTSGIILYGIYFGMSLSSRPTDIKDLEPSLEQIKEELDPSVLDIIEEGIIEIMTEAEKKIVQKAKELQLKQIDEMGTEDSSKKK